MNKTTPEEAEKLAIKHGLILWSNAQSKDLAALIDEVRGVNAECTRSHPHENMNAMCELRTVIARLENEKAHLRGVDAEPVANPVGIVSGILGDICTIRLDGYAVRKGDKLYTHPAPSQPAAPTIKDSLNVQPTPSFEWPECKKCGGNLWQCMACHPAAAPVSSDTINITHPIPSKENAGVILCGLADSLLTIANEFPESLDMQTLDAIEAVLALRTKAAPVELPVVAWALTFNGELHENWVTFAGMSAAEGMRDNFISRTRPCDLPTIGITNLVKLSDAQAAIAAGRKPS